MVNDPHRTGIKGYEIIHCNNISFQGLLLLRSAYWTTTVTDTDNFFVTNIKIVNRKQQYHDDAYDITGNSKHILIQDSFAMTMDDGFAFYGGPELHGGGRDGEELRGLQLHLGGGHRLRRRAEYPAPAL